MELKLYACIYAFQPVLPLYQHQCSLYKEANHIYFLKQFIQHGHIGQLFKQAGAFYRLYSQWFAARFLYLCNITDWVPHLNSGCLTGSMGWKSWPANTIIASGSDHPNISLSPAVHLFLAACFSCSTNPPVV